MDRSMPACNTGLGQFSIVCFYYHIDSSRNVTVCSLSVGQPTLRYPTEWLWLIPIPWDHGRWVSSNNLVVTNISTSITAGITLLLLQTVNLSKLSNPMLDTTWNTWGAFDLISFTFSLVFWNCPIDCIEHDTLKQAHLMCDPSVSEKNCIIPPWTGQWCESEMGLPHRWNRF